MLNVQSVKVLVRNLQRRLTDKEENMSKIRQKGAPTRQTVGSIGDIYTDLDTGLKYKCVGSYGLQTHIGLESKYEWKLLPGEKEKVEPVKKQEPKKSEPVKQQPKVEVKEEPKVEEKTEEVVEEKVEEPKSAQPHNYNKYYNKNNK